MPVAASLLIATTAFVAQNTQQQPAAAPPSVVAGIPVNYDEAKTGNFTLPPLLTLANGKPVKDAKTWMEKRRPEIVQLYEENQFGRAPGRPKDLRFEVVEPGKLALSGKAIRKEIVVHFTAAQDGPRANVVLYLPPSAVEQKRPVPIMLAINFGANALVFDDPEARLGKVWNRDKQLVQAVRGGPAIGRMKADLLLEKGFGIAGVYYGDIDPDFLGGTPNGIRAQYLKPGQTEPAPNEWGSIAAWTWGLSRIMDYLETDKSVDAKRVALYGVSRLGKTVLWAGARDPRFAMVIASCSGEGGAALSRRNYGETIGHLAAPTRYPYQFAANYGKFGGEQVNNFPVDAHMLVALIAPRPLLLQTGDGDKWSDPKGEFLAAVAAEPVYELLGKKGLGITEMPAAGEAVLQTLGYHMHAGGHGTLPGDWPVFVKFMEMHFGTAVH